MRSKSATCSPHIGQHSDSTLRLRLGYVTSQRLINQLSNTKTAMCQSKWFGHSKVVDLHRPAIWLSGYRKRSRFLWVLPWRHVCNEHLHYPRRATPGDNKLSQLRWCLVLETDFNSFLSHRRDSNHQKFPSLPVRTLLSHARRLGNHTAGLWIMPLLQAASAKGTFWPTPTP